MDYWLIEKLKFLFGSLNVEATLQESIVYRRRERPGKMGSGLGLGGVQGTMMEWIKAQGGDKSKLWRGALM